MGRMLRDYAGWRCVRGGRYGYWDAGRGRGVGWIGFGSEVSSLRMRRGRVAGAGQPHNAAPGRPLSAHTGPAHDARPRVSRYPNRAAVEAQTRVVQIGLPLALTAFQRRANPATARG